MDPVWSAFVRRMRMQILVYIALAMLAFFIPIVVLGSAGLAAGYWFSARADQISAVMAVWSAYISCLVSFVGAFCARRWLARMGLARLSALTLGTRTFFVAFALTVAYQHEVSAPGAIALPLIMLAQWAEFRYFRRWPQPA